MNDVYILSILVRFAFVVNILLDFSAIVENVVWTYQPVVMMEIYIKIIVHYYVVNVKRIVILISLIINDVRRRH